MSMQKLLAAYCQKGHLSDSKTSGLDYFALDILDFDETLRWSPEFCGECGSKVFEECPACSKPIFYENKYCEKCGTALPWTEAGLKLAREYTDELEDLSPDEKAELKESIRSITTNSAETPVAASRMSKLIGKAGPAVGNVMLGIVNTLATAEAKKYLGL